MVYCQKCGIQNPDDAQFCNKCGVSLKEPDTKVVQRVEGQKKEITLTKAQVSYLSKGAGLINIIVGGFVFLISIGMFISIVLIIPAIFVAGVGLVIIQGGYTLMKGGVKFNCPYCKKGLYVTSDTDSIKCNRCKELVLLKWV